MNRQIERKPDKLPDMYVRFLFICLGSMMGACHSAQVQVNRPDPMLLLEQQTEFLIRSNPCGCIVDTPELDYEIKLGNHWIRAFVDPDTSDDAAYRTLRSTFLSQPRSTQKISARFNGVLFRWLSGHNAPGISLKNLIDAPESTVETHQF